MGQGLKAWPTMHHAVGCEFREVSGFLLFSPQGAMLWGLGFHAAFGVWVAWRLRGHRCQVDVR